MNLNLWCINPLCVLKNVVETKKRSGHEIGDKEVTKRLIIVPNDEIIDKHVHTLYIYTCLF